MSQRGQALMMAFLIGLALQSVAVAQAVKNDRGDLGFSFAQTVVAE